MATMSKTLPLLTSLLAAAGTLLLGSVPSACDSEGSGTTGRRITLEVKIAATPESKQFVNAEGWAVTITKAAVATGAFYFYDGETLFAGRLGNPRPNRWAALSPVRAAHAHPGHYVPGNTKGEMRTGSSADLLLGGTLGTGDGVTGPVRSATFTFGAPGVGPAAADLGAGVIVLEGSAAKAAEVRLFRAEILPDEVKDAKGVPQIEGCPFEASEMDADGIVAIGIKLPMWFDQVAFEDVPASPDGKPVTLGESLARNQLVRGTRAGLAYTFRYTRR
jgi:hypothetical protein